MICVTRLCGHGAEICSCIQARTHTHTPHTLRHTATHAIRESSRHTHEHILDTYTWIQAYILTYVQRCTQMHAQRHTDTHTHTHRLFPPASFSHQSFLLQLTHTQPPCFGAGPAHLGKQGGRTHYHACSQFCMGLPPKSLYSNMSPEVRGLSSSGREVWPHLRGREPWPQPGALLGLLGMREAALIRVPSRFSGKANAPPPLFPQVIISSSLWNQPIQAEAIWLQTGAPRRA